MTTFVTYQSDAEVIVTSTDQEEATLKEWFAEHTGRCLRDYDRKVHTREPAVWVQSELRVY